MLTRLNELQKSPSFHVAKWSSDQSGKPSWFGGYFFMEVAINKTCGDCGLEKPLSEFYYIKSRSKHSSRCKSCQIIRVDEYHKTKRGLALLIYNRQVSHSKARCHPAPSYTKGWFLKWIFGQSIFHSLYAEWVSSGHNSILKPSVDRIDNHVPYTEENIRVVTWDENQLKAHADMKEGRVGTRCRSVVQTTLDGKQVGEYISMAEASRETGVQRSNISHTIAGRLPHAGGYKWKHKEDG